MRTKMRPVDRLLNRFRKIQVCSDKYHRIINRKEGGKLVFSDVVSMILENYDWDMDEYIILNANDWSYDEFAAFKQTHPKSITYNYEQLSDDSKWWNTNYIKILQSSYKIWDYNKDNIKFLQSKGMNAEYKPVKPTKSLMRLNKVKCDIDVLFYGWPTERRNKIISKLKEELPNINIISLFGVYGTELDRYIERAKIILNIHAFDTFHNQEIVRFLLPLMNKKCILTEHSTDDSYAGDCVLYSDIDNMAATIQNIIDNGLWKTIKPFI